MTNMIPDTVCKSCCFSTWEGETQVGCERGKVEKYKENGAEVLECYDTEREFFVIRGRTCPFWRNQKWRDTMKDKAHEEERLRLETRMNYLATVFADRNLDDIMKTIYSLEAQELKPAEVRIIQEKGNLISPGDIVRATQDVNLFIRIETHTRMMTKQEAVHLAFKFTKTPCQFYSVWEAGTEVAQDFFSTINDYVIQELGQFGAILPERGEYDGLVIPEPVHMYWYFHGDASKTVLENIKEWECDQQQNVCYSMQKLRVARMNRCLQ